MWNSIQGDERAMNESLYNAGISETAARGSQTIGSGELFHRFLDKPTFSGFMESSMGFMGEMGPSAAAAITAALTGSAVGALATGATAGAALPAAAGAIATSGGKVATSLAMKGYTRNMINSAVKKAAKKEQLNKDEIDVMEAVYGNYRSSIMKRNTARGALAGAGSQEYVQGAGTFFGNFADQGMTDPMSAYMSGALGVPFALIGLGSEVVVYKTITNLLQKKGAQQSLLNPGQAKTSIKGRVAKATGISTISESLAELGQMELEIQQKYKIDATYTKEQAYLDRITAGFAGAAGGFGIGGSLGSVTSVVGKANEMLHENQVKRAVETMFNLKMDGDPTGLVMREPESWIRGQFKAMLDPGNNKDAVWVDANSLSELSKIEDELLSQNSNIVAIPLASSVGGVLFTTNPEKAESFSNKMELNVPSQALLEESLAVALDYPRGRLQDDQWVVEVKDKEGNAVHYHQTSNPKNEGETHLEAAREYFNNSPDYTYNLVEAETHITERASIIAPFDYETNSAPTDEAMDVEVEQAIEQQDPVLLKRYKQLVRKAQKVGGLEKLTKKEQQQLQLDYLAIQDILGGADATENDSTEAGVEETNGLESNQDMDDDFGSGVLPQMQEVNLYNTAELQPIQDGELGSDTNPFLGRKGKPWAVPSGKYQNEFPSEEDIEDVLDLYPPGHPFRSEFLELIARKQLSASAVKALINKSGQEITNQNESLRLEVVDKDAENGPQTSYQIVKYSVPIDAPMDLTYNSEIGRMVRRAKKTRAATGFDPDAKFNDPGNTGRKMKTGSRWSVRTKGKNSKPQAVDMPFLVNTTKKYLDKTGFANDAAFGAQLQNSFVTIYEMLAQENSEFELLYDFKPVTEEALQEGIIYTREKGRKRYTFSDLEQFNEDTSKVLRGEEKTTALSSIQDLEIELGILNEQIKSLQQQLEESKDASGKVVVPYEEFMGNVEQLYGPKVGEDPASAKRNDPEKNLLMRRGNIEAEIETLKATIDQSDFLTAMDPSADLQSEENAVPTTEEEWQGEYDSWAKQPLSKNENVKNYSPGRSTKDENAVYPSINGKKINKDTKVEFSETVDEHFKEDAGFIKQVVATANQILGIKKPMLVFSTLEVIDLNDEGMNENLRKKQDEVSAKSGRKGINIPYRDFDVVILDTSPNMKSDLQGLFVLTVGHEIGHSFLRQQLTATLSNAKLRKQLLNMYEKDIKKNPNITAWQGEKGVDEWYADKIAGLLFDMEKGKVFKAGNLAESFLKRVTSKIKAFHNALATKLSKQTSPEQVAAVENLKGRFAYNEQFAEYVKGVNTVQTEATQEQDVQDPGYQERVHIEEMLEAVFGKNTNSHKIMSKLQGIANTLLTTGKLPKTFRKLFETAHRHLERLGTKKGTGSKIANFFHKLSGASGVPGMINEANRLANELGNQMLELLGEEEYTAVVIEALNEAANEEKNTEDLSKKGQIVRKFIESLHERFDLASLGIEKRANFFPRILALNEIAHDDKKKQLLIDLLVEKNPTTTLQVATDVVEDLIRQNQNNLEDTKKDQGEFDVAVAKNRVELFEALKTPELMELGLYQPAEIAFFEYLRKTTRRVEFEKRGGSARLEELVNELPQEEQEIAKEAIDALLGRISPIQNDLWKRATSFGLVTNVVTLLGFAVFASVPDAAGPVLRARELNISSIAKNLYAALTQKEATKFSKSIGANAVESIAQWVLLAGETDAMMPTGQKITSKFFEYTQLERWTRFTRTFAAGMAKDFLFKHADNVKNGIPNSESVLTSQRYLRELGITGAEVDAWGGGSLDAHPKIKTAAGRFVDEAIVRPNAAERPIWASDPHYALAWQLKSFYYAYGKNIIGGLFREGKTVYGTTKGNIPQAAVPLVLGAALLLPLTMLGWDLRERFKIGLAWLLPGISPNDPGVNYRKTQSMGSGEYWFELLDRSGALGAYALAIPLVMEDKRYGSPFFVPIFGPSAEKSWDILSGGFDATDYIPAYSQLNTNALTYKQ